MSMSDRVRTFFGSDSKQVLLLVAVIVLVVLFVRFFIAQPFVVRGESMSPTFQNGNYLVIDEVSYRLEDPARGDVVVFRYPNNPAIFYIKRIIGLPGETVRITKGEVTIAKTDGTELVLPEPYVVAEDATYTFERMLNEGEYFVMGDNRPKSSDSRVWGPLPEENIMGRAMLRLFPLSEAGVLPGAIEQIQ